ncbi:hypothetical protein [Octadecabacter ascidiaceicola]|uniref:Uncharacterized protein n=1 Tax=Octadecabacter ascidiaceicola TaxID=1655543 RepID=A0A238JK13_9RHOB|nr:hypothetical protein [Octadecabacter ascidiaceicola]SMX30743.1 hypothetical protein OCA8868_00006 [Octadecabacter ascidiaceicola]
MTANQIMIPLALLLLVAWVILLVVRSRRIAQASTQREHLPNAPSRGLDADAPAKESAENAGRGNFTGGY